MKKIYYLLALLLTCSCYPHHIDDSNFAGVYTGSSSKSRSVIGYNYHLELKENGSCEFIKYFDINTILGKGKWTKQGKNIIIKYDSTPTDISSVLMAGSYMKGVDTIKICNSNILRFNNDKLRK